MQNVCVYIYIIVYVQIKSNMFTSSPRSHDRSYWCLVGNGGMIRTNYQQSSHSPIPYSAPVSLPLAFLGQFQASVASLLHAAASKDEVHIGIHPGFNLLIVHEICGYIMKYYELL